jgi:group II intron reverse transcriptase/maturase
MAGGWIIELDIRKYFDSIDHERLGEVLRRRIRDGVILRLIGKWLHAGVLEDGSIKHPESGSLQGGVVSPVLANIFPHEVLDVWFDRDVRPRIRGRAHLVRYADDAVMLFEDEEDARRVVAVLPQRFGKYGLTLHPEKTRLAPFKRPDRMKRTRDRDEGPDAPATFDFLGFTLHCGKTPRAVGGEDSNRIRPLPTALKSISEWCKAHRHEPPEEQQRVLNLRLRGHYAYYGRRGNRARLWALLHRVTKAWRRWMQTAMARLLKRYPLLEPPAVQIA